MKLAFRSWLSVIATAAAAGLPATVAHGLTLCEFAAFKPSALQHHLEAALRDTRTSVVPMRHLNDGEHAGDLAIIRDSRVYGYLRATSALAGAETALQIDDAKGGVLALAESDTYVCDGGWCRSTEFTTALDEDADTESALRLTQEPTYGLRYLVYGDEVGVTSWRAQWGDRFEWLVAALADESQSVALTVATRAQAVRLALANAPEVVPYLDVLNVTTTAQGQVVLSGRVPHDIYDRALDATRAAGFYDVRPEIIIDSGARIVTRSDDLDLQRCFGW